jgi:hypothetical protein
MRKMTDHRQYAPATVRNRDFILDVLRDVLPTTGVILEIASGSGEHVVHFARNLPSLVFQPSDPEPDALLSVAAWMKAWGGHRYFERIDPAQDPNGSRTIHFNEGDFLAHDVADFGFLDLVRLGVVAPDDPSVATSLAPSAAGSDGNSTVQVTMPNGDIYFHRYNHDGSVANFAAGGLPV